MTQTEFGTPVGVSQQAVSELVRTGVLQAGDPWHTWLLAYCERLREQAAGRMGGELGGLDLVQERAALAREQRIAQRVKNDVARGLFAPVGLLADVLGSANSAVVDRFDQLDSALRKVCPDLPADARTAVHAVIASARNEWLRATAKLVDDRLEQLAAEALDDDDGDVPVEAE
jgi:Phage DNA packaging protein, Nu1 subunit of terminase